MSDCTKFGRTFPGILHLLWAGRFEAMRQQPGIDMSTSACVTTQKLTLIESEDAERQDKSTETTPPGPLYYAVKLHLTDVAITLITEQNVNETSSLGRSALGMACANGCLAVVDVLLNKGANFTVTTESGLTPVNLASINGHVEVVKLLLENGADITVATKKGWTPLYSASANGHVEVVKLLLEEGADITFASNSGWTPVNSASANGHVDARRQGEAEPIIDLMNEHGLRSLLPRGTRTWQGQDQESTIDLILVTSELADEMITCVPHSTDHGSDHRAIHTTFDVTLPERITTPRLMFKNAPWNSIRARVEDGLRELSWTVDVQAQTDQFMRVVLEAIDHFTPRAEPTPYAKRWWTRDLTQLRQSYAFWRNQARSQRRTTHACPDLERRAKEAAKEYPREAFAHLRAQRPIPAAVAGSYWPRPQVQLAPLQAATTAPIYDPFQKLPSRHALAMLTDLGACGGK
ncbi:hypothetical protein O9K51_10979 [Purpureocillium lavendulum]|uniref:Endonuclease/exonuclease/phosphatase domain-containing protein n=1 Tax=Purpureocillium lavendulum TaxID=1247861 RepID=A0AB34FC99_9HYPO|nr:hypothetical protein O9K51_10979 [Purpureocillium lavendulum]